MNQHILGYLRTNLDKEFFCTCERSEWFVGIQSGTGHSMLGYVCYFDAYGDTYEEAIDKLTEFLL